ncbi:MAG: tRNA pseudouridine(38-40) synthase TruA [Chloroflexi bacterium]|nr:tRNA pseudouridine(38-40) synthase TruA [Chloroflexota bacterium]
MARYQLILAYDGTQFQGFQRQAYTRTVQGVVEAALRQLSWEGRSILSAGRTDTGVHAVGQVAAFDLDWRHPLPELQNALNALLPLDVAVREVREAAADFHPRYDALARRYRYRCYCQGVRDPLRERIAWKVWPGLEGDTLVEAAGLLQGSHDFSAFGSPPKPHGSTLRTVYTAGWMQQDSGWVFEIQGNAFLYHMVRRLVYLQVLIGQERLTLSDFQAAIDRQQPLPPGLAPARGLTLVEVLYPAPEQEEQQSNFVEGSVKPSP